MTATAPEVVAVGRVVRLRVKQLEDASRDFEWRRDPELAAYDAAQPLGMSLRAFVSTLADEIKSPTQYRRTFAIEDREVGLHIGNVMYYGYDPHLREAELGITIGNRDYWSRGYGTDAVHTMVGYLFGTLGLRRVYLHTLTWNSRAQRAFENAGFRRVREVYRSGHDFVHMEVLREEFLAQDASADHEGGSHTEPGSASLA